MSTTSADRPVLSVGAPDKGPLAGYRTRAGRIAGIVFTGIWLEAAADTMRGRIVRRSGDVSDATPDVLDEQLAFDLGPQNFAVVDAGRPVDQVVASCLELIRSPKG